MLAEGGQSRNGLQNSRFAQNVLAGFRDNLDLIATDAETLDDIVV